MGRCIDKRNGYALVYIPGPNGTKGKMVREHRVVAEQMLGRPLRKGEQVHHVNGIKSDNRPENLKVMQSAHEHMQHHRADWSRKYPCCLECGTTSVRHNADGLCLNCYMRRFKRTLRASQPPKPKVPRAPRRRDSYGRYVR